MTAREKALARLRKILRRARSPYPEEAANARRRAAEIAEKYGITEAEVAAVTSADRPKRYAAAGDVRDTWLRNLALAVARARGCRALDRRGTAYFEGDDANVVDDAAALHRKVAEELAAQSELHFASCGYNHAPAMRAIWDAIFLSEAARAMLDPESPEIPHATHGVSIREIEEATAVTPIRGATLGIFLQNANNSGRRYGRSVALEKRRDPVARPGTPGDRPAFVVADGLVLASSRDPGNYATLFADGRRLPHRGDLSMWDDEGRDYTWVFEGAAPPGTRLVFATADRAVCGLSGVPGADPRARAHVIRNSETGEPCEVSIWVPRVLVLVLSSLAPPYGRLLDAQRKTWAAAPGAAEVRWYFPESLAAGAAALREELARALDDASWSHVFRTNSSSYVDLDRLVAVAGDLSLEGIYAGVDGGGFASGSGFFLSRDAAEILAQDLPREPTDAPDDVACGAVLARASFQVAALPRVDYEIERAVALARGALGDFEGRVREAHHVRVKHADRARDVVAMEDVHRIKMRIKSTFEFTQCEANDLTARGTSR